MSTKLITLLEDLWDAKIQAKSAHINFFTCSLYLDGINIKPRNKQRQFSWGFDDGKIYISPFSYASNKELALSITLNNVSGKSGYLNGSYDLADHITTIFCAPASELNVAIKSIVMNNIHLDVTRNDQTISCIIPGKLSMCSGDNSPTPFAWTGECTTTNGQLSLNNNSLLSSFTTKIQCRNPKKTTNWHFTGTSTFAMSNIHKEAIYTCTTTWTAKDKVLTLQDNQKNIQLNATATSDGLAVDGTVTLQTLLSLPRLFNPSQPLPENVKGDCKIHLDCTQQPTLHANGKLVIANTEYKNLTLQEIAATIDSITTEKAKLHLTASVCQGLELEGACSMNFVDKKVSLALYNNKQIQVKQLISPSFNEWIIIPKRAALKASCSVTNDGVGISGNYALRLLNQVTEKESPYHGSFCFNRTDGQITGKTKSGSYLIQGQLSTHPLITRWFYAGKHHTLIDLHMRDSDNTLEGQIRYNFLMSFLPYQVRHVALGHDCTCWLTLQQKDFNCFRGSVGLHHGKLYIPENRNLIEKFHTNFKISPARRRLFLNDFEVGFCKGSIKSPQMTLQYDKQFNVDLLHIPLQIDNLFVNWKNDVYGFICGNLLLNKLPLGGPKLSGNIVLKKTLLRDNMLSDIGGSNLYSPMGNINTLFQNFAMDLFVTNEKPIKAKTSTLETFANINMRIQYLPNKDLVLAPHITGSINLDHGYLQFLQNKLFIEYGKIQFIPNQMNDPIIDLVAKNKINRYQITLQATGSLQKPNIILESSPELTDEQILGLIFAGSENATLQADLPLMLVQNLNSIVLGSNKLLPQGNKIFEKITRPFKYVQIIPNFTDATGRGGIKGVVSVNLSNQLKAQVQKNLNLQDDFSAQLEYALTDDINFKVVKDQRDELGSEVELRVKL